MGHSAKLVLLGIFYFAQLGFLYSNALAYSCRQQAAKLDGSQSRPLPNKLYLGVGKILKRQSRFVFARTDAFEANFAYLFVCCQQISKQEPNVMKRMSVLIFHRQEFPTIILIRRLLLSKSLNLWQKNFFSSNDGLDAKYKSLTESNWKRQFLRIRYLYSKELRTTI